MRKVIKKIVSDLDKLNGKTPEQEGAINLFKNALDQASHLDVKTKDLINIALAISHQPSGFADRTIKIAFNDGISQEEIIGAASLALIQLNGAAISAIKPLMDSINKYYLENLRSDCYWLDAR